MTAEPVKCERSASRRTAPAANAATAAVGAVVAVAAVAAVAAFGPPTRSGACRERGAAEIAARVRRECFARTGPLTARYGVTPERVVDFFLDRSDDGRGTSGARSARAARAARMIDNLEDIIHAMACRDDHPFAWLDLRELHESALIRVCAARIGDAPAIMLVRSWIDALRHRSSRRRPGSSEARVRTTAPPCVTVPVIAADGGRATVCVGSLDGYAGATPLRHWLAQHLVPPLVERDRAGVHAVAPLGLTVRGEALPLSRSGSRSDLR